MVLPVKEEGRYGQRLFLVGNGIDLMHGMATGWTDFQEWWLNGITAPQSDFVKALKDPGYCGEDVFARAKRLLRQGRISVEDGQIAVMYRSNSPDQINEALFIDLCDIAVTFNDCHGHDGWDPCWSDFESLLKYLCLANPDEWNDDDDQDRDWGVAGLFADLSEMTLNVLALENRIRSWIGTVRPAKFRYDGVRHALDHADRIVSFNYTDTIETLYDRTVFHIHGRLNSEDELIVGCEPPDEDSDAAGDQAVYGIRNWDFRNFLKKPSQTKELEDELSDAVLTDVMTLGFSFGVVDQPLVERIVQHTNRYSTWLSYVHRDGEAGHIARFLCELGYEGRLSFDNSSTLTV